MTETKGKHGGRRPNQTGRPPSNVIKVRLDALILPENKAWLARNGARRMGAEIDKLVREAIERGEA